MHLKLTIKKKIRSAGRGGTLAVPPPHNIYPAPEPAPEPAPGPASGRTTVVLLVLYVSSIYAISS